jgi:hypothetical protein
LPAAARRNLAPGQKKEILKAMKEIALALRKEDPKKNTQEVVARLLGVAQHTVSDWFTTNTGAGISSKPPSKPDARVTIPREDRPKVAEEVKNGKSQAQVAAGGNEKTEGGNISTLGSVQAAGVGGERVTPCHPFLNELPGKCSSSGNPENRSSHARTSLHCQSAQRPLTPGR